MREDAEPLHVAKALTDLFALRGYARQRADRQLQEAWEAVAGADIAAETRAVAVSRGVLQVEVSNAPLLGELVGFHRTRLLKLLKEKHPDLRIRDLKFRLQTGTGADPR